MLAIINQVNAGQIRLLAVTSPKRVASLPEVPTVSEAGVPGYEASSWYMVLAPAKTPAPLIHQIHRETVTALKAKDMLDMLAKGGTEPLGNTPTEAMTFLPPTHARRYEAHFRALDKDASIGFFAGNSCSTTADNRGNTPLVPGVPLLPGKAHDTHEGIHAA